jgi:hypothetical protein
MKNCTKNTAVGEKNSRSLIESQQLSLFGLPQVEKSNKQLYTESDKPFPLQIGYIPDKLRSAPDRFCRLIHYESQPEIPGQYTHPQAEEILRITRDWDWELNGLGIPRCRDKLLLLLDKFSNKGGEADA